MPGPATDGDFFSPPPLGEWNDIRDLARYRPKPNVRTLPPIQTDRLQLKNTTGSSIVAGRVLQVGTSIITTLEEESLWLNGIAPAPNGLDEILISLDPVPNDEYGWFQGVGYCVAAVNIVHESHPFADVDSGSTLLQSKWHGRARIVKKASTGTGEKQCLICLGHMFRGPILCNATSGITAGSSANCAVYVASVAASPAATISVHLKDLDGGNNLASGKFLWAWWKPDDQRYEVGNAEC